MVDISSAVIVGLFLAFVLLPIIVTIVTVAGTLSDTARFVVESNYEKHNQ